jgi:hypothetical protein
MIRITESPTIIAVIPLPLLIFALLTSTSPTSARLASSLQT